VDPLKRIEERLKPLRLGLLTHPIYQEIDQLESLRVFMEHHVFAVWDFMSLLKALQRHLTCVAVPWVPGTDAQACRFVNEIVLAEESDEDGRGGYASHFELYYRSMTQCGADTTVVDCFLNTLKTGAAIPVAFQQSNVPLAARRFVQQTFHIVERGRLCAIASAFTFGREDLLPAVFERIVDSLNVESGGKLEDFKYYLERHIGLDGDEHGPMAQRLLQSLCGSDVSLWLEAEQAAVDSLSARCALWDGIHAAVQSLSQTSA
jgi:hypothetical protein